MGSMLVEHEVYIIDNDHGDRRSMECVKVGGSNFTRNEKKKKP